MKSIMLHVASGCALLTCLSSVSQQIDRPVWFGSRTTTAGTARAAGEDAVLDVIVVEGDGAAVSGANVMVTAGPTQNWTRGQTDQEGKATFRLAPGKCRIRTISKPPHINMNDTIDVDLQPGKTVTKRVEVPTMPKVKGVLRDESGQPVAGAVVRVLPSGGIDTRSDEAGRFVASWAPRTWGGHEPRRLLVARHAERELAVALDLPLATETGGIVLRRGWTVTGRVTDENGNGIAKANVNAMVRGENWSSSMSDARTVTDGTGRYRIACLPPDRGCRVHASADGYGPAATECEATDQVVAMPEIVLRRADLAITGTVLDEEGKPVADAQVSAYGTGQPQRNAKSGADGRFRIDGVCEGEMRLHGYRHGNPFLQGSAQTEGGETDVRLVLLVPGSQARASRPREEIPFPKLGEDFDPAKAHRWFDFQNGGENLAPWSRKDVYACGDTGTIILGRFADDSVELTLKDLPEHRFVRVYLELYVLASWDGHGRYWGPDLWLARVENGPRLVCSSFSNESGLQSYPFPFHLGEAAGGTGGRSFDLEITSEAGRTSNTHVVYPMCFTFPHDDAELTLQFTGIGLQGVDDESWGLDNVGVELLDATPWKESEPDALADAWEALGSRDVATSWSAMEQLVSAGEQAASYVRDRLGWHADPALHEEIEELVEILNYSDWYQWREASEDAGSLDPRLRPLVDSLVDARRFDRNLLPWINEFFSPKDIPEARDAVALRTGRAARVLERIWTDTAREALLVK